MAKILNVSNDVALLNLRHQILQALGEPVVSAPPDRSLDEMDGRSFDILITCFQIPADVIDDLCLKFRIGNAAGRWVRINGTNTRTSFAPGLCEPDLDVDAFSPQQLVRAVKTYTIARDQFTRPRALVHSQELWPGWFCERCCWTVRQDRSAIFPFRNFMFHSCESFARKRWRSWQDS